MNTRNYGPSLSDNSFYYDEVDEIAKYLIQKGANLNIEDEDGNTPLFWSRNKGRTLFYYLVQNGADIHHRNKHNETVLKLNTQLDHFFYLKIWNCINGFFQRE